MKELDRLTAALEAKDGANDWAEEERDKRNKAEERCDRLQQLCNRQSEELERL